MLDEVLEEIATPELLERFRKMWLLSGEEAAAELREIVELIGKSDAPDEKAAVLGKVIAGMVGEEPDLRAWLETIAAGSFKLRPDQEYAYSSLKSDARFLEQRKPLVAANVATSGFPALHKTQEGVRLIASSMLLKELRRILTPLRAVGPAWPVMLAIMQVRSPDNLFRRRLHHFGGDQRLIRLLRLGARWAMRRYIRERGSIMPPAGGPAAAWKDKLPPDAKLDNLRHVLRRAAGSEPKPLASRLSEYQVALTASLVGRTTPAISSEVIAAAQANSASFKRELHSILGKERVSAALQYLPDFERGASAETTYSDEQIAKLRRWMPTIASGNRTALLAMAARFQHRSVDRSWEPEFGHPEAAISLRAIAHRISHFARKHGPPPPEVPFGHIGLWEEAAAEALMEPLVSFPALEKWQRLGFLLQEAEPCAPDEIYRFAGC
jgi:hypothetical protein